MRVFVRDGRPYAAEGLSEAIELVRLGERLVRLSKPAFSPERHAFDATVESHALRRLWSGMPMYRVDDR